MTMAPGLLALPTLGLALEVNTDRAALGAVVDTNNLSRVLDMHRGEKDGGVQMQQTFQLAGRQRRAQARTRTRKKKMGMF